MELRQIEILNTKVEELTNMLELKNRYTTVDGVIAKVIEQSKNNLEEVYTIDVGKNQGIKEGMAVVYANRIIWKDSRR